MGPAAQEVIVSKRQRPILEKLVRASTTPQQHAERAHIALMSSNGESNAAQAQYLDVDEQRVRRWRRRWALAELQLKEAEEAGASDKDLSTLITGVLSDKHRSGTTPTFTAEQVVQILAVACESPGDSGLPVSHWAPKELAQEVIYRGIVESISPRHVDRFLKGSRDPTTHR